MLPQSSYVSLNIYNSVGEKIATLADKNYPAGLHTVEWNGSEFSSGIYLYRIVSGSFVETKKLMLLK